MTTSPPGRTARTCAAMASVRAFPLKCSMTPEETATSNRPQNSLVRFRKSSHTNWPERLRRSNRQAAWFSAASQASSNVVSAPWRARSADQSPRPHPSSIVRRPFIAPQADSTTRRIHCQRGCLASRINSESSRSTVGQFRHTRSHVSRGTLPAQCLAAPMDSESEDGLVQETSTRKLSGGTTDD